MVIARKIAYNVAFSSFSKILSTILALVSIGLITRYLGQAGFGNYATVLAFLSFFTAIADLGLYSTVTREISRPGADEEKIVGNIFTLRMIISLVVLILSPVVVFFFPYPTEVKEAIIIVALSFLFSSSYQVLNGIFQKNLAMDRVAVAELLGKIVQVLFIFFAIKFKLNFLWIISSLLLNMALSFFLVYFWSKKYISFSFKFDIVYWKKFVKESYPLGIAAIISFIYFKIDTILLSVLKTSAEVGIYNVAYKVIENISFFPAMIAGLVFPIMAKNIFSDKKSFQNISDKTFKVFWIFVIPLIIGTMFLSGGIVELIGGKGFFASSVVLRILIFSLGCIFFGNFFNVILISGNKQKKLMTIMAIAAIFNVSANLIFIPRYSYLAAAIISTATELFVTLAAFYVAVKDLGYFPKAEKFWAILLSGAVMAVYFFIFSKMNFFLLAFSGTAVYIVFIWIFKVVKTQEITSIISKKETAQYELP
ncbi:MAG TPA: flippase [Candidatus Moranbacteria bacterium]|nr:flippase [Candidatus Moranbacteria bacterium]